MLVAGGEGHAASLASPALPGRRPPPPGITSAQHLHVDLISTSFGAGQLAAEERLGGRPGDQPGRPAAGERGGQPTGLRLWAVAIGNYL
jgi:hypothetical protein